MSDTTPILESIAENIKTTVNSITIANGYNQDLVAMRSKLVDYADAPPAEGLVLLEQDTSPEEAEAQPSGSCDIDQVFYLVAHVMSDDAATHSIDTRCNRIYADIKKALMADHTRGRYAMDTHVLPQQNFKVENEKESFAGVIAPVVISYRTQYSNPYA